MTFNPLTAIIDADKTWPGAVPFPKALESATLEQLTEAYLRLTRLREVAAFLQNQLAERITGFGQ